MFRLFVVFGVAGFAITNAWGNDNCGRVMLLPDHGQEGLCLTSDCGERSATRIAHAGEVVDACRHDATTWAIADGQTFFFADEDLAPEMSVDGQPCFSLDMAAALEAGFFDPATRLSGNGKVFDAALEFTGRIRNAVVSRIAGPVDVCPTMKHPRVATPDRQGSDARIDLPQRMVVSSVVTREDGSADRWRIGPVANRGRPAGLTVSASLEAYCIDADKRAPEAVDSFTLLTGENGSTLSSTVRKTLANTSLAPEVTLHCIWLARDYESKPGEAMRDADRDMLDYCRSDEIRDRVF